MGGSSPKLSPAEREVKAREPPTSASSDEKMLWRMELLAARQQNPVAPPYVFSGKVIRANVQLDTETPLPVGMRTWMDCPMVEMFRRDEGLSLADQDNAWRGDGRPGKEKVTKPPAKPADSNEFYLFSKRLERYMLDSDRWDLAEARLHDLHREDVMDLLQHHDLEDVLLYDSDFRFTRHRMQDRRWSSRDADIFRKRVTDPLHRRARDSSPAGSSPSSPPSSGKSTTRAFFDRPCYKQMVCDGTSVCAKWNWGIGCLGCGPSKDVSACEGSRFHVCSFCNADHRVMDCSAYTHAHSADAALGYAGQRGK